MKSTASNLSRTWPMLIDIDKDECKRMLRRFELQAYASVVTALRAQGDLNLERRKVLRDLADILNIPIERHKCEVRRVLNDERLYTIAYNISGPSVFQEWTIEGKRLIPLLPRIEPKTAFTTLANKFATIEAKRNATLPMPMYTRSLKIKPSNIITKKPSNDIPAKRPKLSESTPAKSVHPSNSTTVVNNQNNNNNNNINNNNNNNHNNTVISTPSSVSRRNKSQDSKNKEKDKTPARTVSNQSHPIYKAFPNPSPVSSLSSSGTSSQPSGITIKTEALQTATIISAKKLPKVCGSSSSTGKSVIVGASGSGNELLIKTPENETHVLVPFSVSGTPSIGTPAARRVISVSPSFGAKLSAKSINAQKTDLTLSAGSGQKLHSVASGAGNSANTAIITSIVNTSTLTPSIITGNVAGTQDSGNKGNIVNIVPLGSVSQQRILQHQSGTGNSATGSTGNQSISGPVLQQQVFVIPAGNSMSDIKSVTKVGSFPLQTITSSGLTSISGDVHHVQQSSGAQHHILQQPKVHSYPQTGQKIISIPLESTKPNFLSGKPKFTYGMKAMTSAKIQLPVQQALPAGDNVPEKSTQVHAPVTLTPSTSVPMTSIPVTITPVSLPATPPTSNVTVAVSNAPITSLPLSTITSTPTTSLLSSAIVSVANTAQTPKTVSVPVTVTTTVSPNIVPLSVTPISSVSSKSSLPSTSSVTETPKTQETPGEIEPSPSTSITTAPVTVTLLPAKPAIMSTVTDDTKKIHDVGGKADDDNIIPNPNTEDK